MNLHFCISSLLNFLKNCCTHIIAITNIAHAPSVTPLASMQFYSHQESNNLPCEITKKKKKNIYKIFMRGELLKMSPSLKKDKGRGPCELILLPIFAALQLVKYLYLKIQNKIKVMLSSTLANILDRFKSVKT